SFLLFFFILMILPPPSFTLFPYTTLFRSVCVAGTNRAQYLRAPGGVLRTLPGRFLLYDARSTDRVGARCRQGRGARLRLRPPARSEEHTSELQSRSDLVCRLLLEKKKKR